MTAFSARHIMAAQHIEPQDCGRADCRPFLGDHTTAITTPLAPSVEKAYYRKCIELKRRLNEVEAANDELKVKRLCLDRGIMKMRLERAFLLDELRKRMEHNGDGSEGSGEDGMTTVCALHAVRAR